MQFEELLELLPRGGDDVRIFEGPWSQRPDYEAERWITGILQRTDEVDAGAGADADADAGADAVAAPARPRWEPRCYWTLLSQWLSGIAEQGRGAADARRRTLSQKAVGFLEDPDVAAALGPKVVAAVVGTMRSGGRPQGDIGGLATFAALLVGAPVVYRGHAYAAPGIQMGAGAGAGPGPGFELPASWGEGPAAHKKGAAGLRR